MRDGRPKNQRFAHTYLSFASERKPMHTQASKHIYIYFCTNISQTRLQIISRKNTHTLHICAEYIQKLNSALIEMGLMCVCARAACDIKYKRYFYASISNCSTRIFIRDITKIHSQRLLLEQIARARANAIDSRAYVWPLQSRFSREQSGMLV